MTFRSSSAISENSIVFFEGGHDHDGVSSSLIDTEQYSIYDFIVGKTGSNARQIRQQRNFDNLKTVVSNIVINDVLGPSGIRLLPNSVQSVHIAAGAITANELAANIVLVNNVISSNNYVPNTSGWVLYSNGTAEFGAASIRGTLTAAAVSTPGVEIYSNGVLAASNFVILANGAFGNNNFDVDASGNLTAINANISGTINANSGSIAGWVISSDMISADSGNIALYQEPGYGSIIAGTGAGTQIILDSEASLHAEFAGIDTDINFKTDTAYVFRISGGGSLARISPYLFSASAGGQFSFLAYNEIYTNGEVGMQTGNVNGIGIAYPGCTTGPGTPNYMGLVWDQPDIRGTVDNVVSAVLGTVSDVRSKTNIINAPEDWALKTLNDLRVVEYNPIDIVNVDNTSLGSKRLGLIAQEVINVFPDLVTSADPSNPGAILSVNYLGLVPHLIQVVKILNNEIQSIKQQIGE